MVGTLPQEKSRQKPLDYLLLNARLKKLFAGAPQNVRLKNRQPFSEREFRGR